MATIERRQKLALDESYRYYRSLEKEGESPALYELVKCFKTVTIALNATENGHFKLTRQLWRRIHQAFFDKLVINFPGYLIIQTVEGESLQPKTTMPEEGMVEFHPDGCRRKDDIFRMEIKHLYPGTQYAMAKIWQTKGARTTPEDFAGPQCGESGCFLKPVLLGEEVLQEESLSGKQLAYHDWWDLFQQAFCTEDTQERHIIQRRMDELEAVWGNLYY